MKTRNLLITLCLFPSALGLSGCATGHTKDILWGMAAGAAVGAAVGNQYVHHGEYGQFRSQNTATTAALAAIGTGLVLNWHYNSLAEQEVAISGRYARTRLCDPAQLDPALVKQLSGEGGPQALPLTDSQIGKKAIHLDDETKWAFPAFQKRYLQPERGETQLLSSRYIWEVIRPGQFVTRSQNPEYFVETRVNPETEAAQKPKATTTESPAALPSAGEKKETP